MSDCWKEKGSKFSMISHQRAIHNWYCRYCEETQDRRCVYIPNISTPWEFWRLHHHLYDRVIVSLYSYPKLLCFPREVFQPLVHTNEIVGDETHCLFLCVLCCKFNRWRIVLVFIEGGNWTDLSTIWFTGKISIEEEKKVRIKQHLILKQVLHSWNRKLTSDKRDQQC